MSISIDVSYGELIDKITILEIKVERVTNSAKLLNIRKELALLKGISEAHIQNDSTVQELTNKLRFINVHLWEVEDKLRKKEQCKIFDDEFIELARSVYFTNDQRAKIKRELNEFLNSSVIEEKDYQSY